VPNSAFWVYRVFALFGKTVSDLQHPGHVRFFSLNTLYSFLQTAGFSNIKISGRNMYFLIGNRPEKLFDKILPKLGFEKEFRFKANKFFWHMSRYVGKASNFWSDTFIIEATKE